MASDTLTRRKFLSRIWAVGYGLILAAGLWTTWDLIRPGSTSGFGGKVRAVPPEAVPENGVIEVPQARSYLVDIEGEILALSQKCTHLGCRVPYCDSSSQFECPCHGSRYNRVGERRGGPAPRGMDRFAMEVTGSNEFVVDTGAIIEGPPIGTDTTGQEPEGPSCVGAASE